MHPVDVAAQGVDFAVVGHVTIGMSAVPAGKSVGAETRMDQRNGRLHRRIVEIGEILRQLVGQQHALVDNGSARKTGDIPGLGSRHGGGANLRVGALADEVETALESVVISDISAPPDEDLPHYRFA